MTILINGTPVSGIYITGLIALIVALTGLIPCFISEKSKYTAQIIFQIIGILGTVLLIIGK